MVVEETKSCGVVYVPLLGGGIGHDIVNTKNKSCVASEALLDQEEGIGPEKGPG